MTKILKGPPPITSNHEPPSTQPAVRSIPIAQIRLDGGTQTRVKLRQETVEEYAEIMSEIAANPFPPVVVFTEGDGSFVLADGFHRVHAASRLGNLEIMADVRPGGRLKAFLYSLGANNGLRRTSLDKRHSVLLALNEESLRDSSDRVIAGLCGVSNHLVAAVRSEHEQSQGEQLGDSPSSTAPAKRKGHDGKLRSSGPKARKVPAQSVAVPVPDATANSVHTVTPTTTQRTDDPPGGQNANAGTESTAPPAEIAIEDRADASNDSVKTVASVEQLPEEFGPATSLASEVPQTAELSHADAAPSGALVSEDQLQERLGRIRETHPSDRYDEQQTELFKHHIVSFVHTANRLTSKSTLQRSIHKRVAADAATALGKFIASLPSLPD